MENRSTSELIEVLGNEVSRCHEELLKAIDEGTVDSSGNVEADYEYQARQLVRTIFAFIEGVTFSMKVKAASHCLDKGIEITDGERFFAVDQDHILTDTGRVIERPAHIRLSDNVRFASALQEKALGIAKPFDSSCEWWSCFKSSIKVRDRLTHPKMPEDIDVSGDEIVSVLTAYEGFKGQALNYSEHYKDQTRAVKK